MALKEVWIGSVGPFVYDDDDVYADDPTIKHMGIRTDGFIRTALAPVLGGDVLRKDDVGAGQLVAPVDASYVVIALSGSLDAERRLQVGTGLTLTDGGANGDITIDLALSYGSMYSITDMAITMTTQNVWYEIDAAAAWVTGKLNNCTFTDPYITVTNAGTYLITWNIGGRIGTANQVVRCGIMIDRTVTDNPTHGLPGVQGEGRGVFEFLNAARRLNTGGSAILTLAAGRTVSLAVRNLTSAAKVLTVGVGNLKVVRIGG